MARWIGTPTTTTIRVAVAPTEDRANSCTHYGCTLKEGNTHG